MSHNDKNSDDKESGNKAFLQHSRELLDDSVDSLDAATLSRLNQVRQKALNTRRPNFFLATRTGAVFASFTVAALAVLLWTTMSTQSPGQQLAQQLSQQYEDIEMLTSDADLDLLEDLEFVSWLVEENMDPGEETNDAS